VQNSIFLVKTLNLSVLPNSLVSYGNFTRKSLLTKDLQIWTFCSKGTHLLNVFIESLQHATLLAASELLCEGISMHFENPPLHRSFAAWMPLLHNILYEAVIRYSIGNYISYLLYNHKYEPVSAAVMFMVTLAQLNESKPLLSQTSPLGKFIFLSFSGACFYSA
jgi:hypothetical protein